MLLEKNIINYCKDGKEERYCSGVIKWNKYYVVRMER